jgi:hypothetical protein
MTNNKRFVRITEELIKNKEEHDTKVTNKKTRQVKFDTTKIQVFSIDGCIPYLDNEEGRIMFFTNVSSVGGIDDEDKKLFNQCIAEMRMTPSTMQRIISLLAKEMFNYERYKKKKNEIQDGPIKQDQPNHVMFG